MNVITIKVDDAKLRRLIRGQPVRPAQQHRNRKHEQNRRACRGWKDEG